MLRAASIQHPAEAISLDLYYALTKSGFGKESKQLFLMEILILKN